MSIKTGVNAPKTPVTAGSHDVAPATLPNICKMPGPPAPFIPTPLPNIGKSELSPKGYSTSVKIEGNAVAIRGATYESIGDMASKGTGGGLISANCHGPTKFITPGSMNVKIEGKNVHLLSEPMLNNCGPSGSPPNTGATMNGNIQMPEKVITGQELLEDIWDDCDKNTPAKDAKGDKKSCRKLGTDKHACCEEKIQKHRKANPEDGNPPVEGEKGYKRPNLDNNRPILPAPPPQPTGGPRPNLGVAFKEGGDAIKAAFAALKGNCYPDAAIINSDGSKRFVDFKFPCPKGHPAGRGTSKGGAKTGMSPRQQGSYDSLGFGTGNGKAIVIV